MRPLVAVLLLAAGCLNAQPGGVAGMVVDHTGKPLAGVHVRLVTNQFDLDNGPQIYGAISDKAGRFSVEGVQSGVYFVSAERTGFVQKTSRMSTLGVKPGQHVADYKIEMAARVLLAGRVVDEFGDPVPNANVQVQPVAPDQPEGYASNGSVFMTDDRGEFHLITGPGKYYLQAMETPRFYGGPEIRTDGTSSAHFAATYYPNAANTGSASAIEAAAGQDVTGLDIRLLRMAAAGPRGLTISGVVTGAPESNRTTVLVRSGEAPGQYNNTRGSGVGDDGRFALSGLEPAFYAVIAYSSSGKTMLESRTVEFHLESDETGLELVLSAGEEIAGKLEFVGGAPAGKHTLRLQRDDMEMSFGQPEPPSAEAAPDGSFRLTGVLPEKFKIAVEPMPENGYLQEVALNGESIPGQVLDFSQGAGGAQLKITVDPHGAEISGRVLDKDGDPAIDMLSVFFGMDAKHMELGNQGLVHDGKFSFKGMRPGKYRLLVMSWTDLQPFYGRDPGRDDVMQRLFEAGEEIELKPGDHISKDIRLTTKLPEKKEGK
jgi:hypothetical protein